MRTSGRQVKRWHRFRVVPFFALAVLAGASGARAAETCAGREQGLVPQATSPDPTDSKEAAQARLVETLCHLDPARPECREAD